MHENKWDFLLDLDNVWYALFWDHENKHLVNSVKTHSLLTLFLLFKIIFLLLPDHEQHKSLLGWFIFCYAKLLANIFSWRADSEIVLHDVACHLTWVRVRMFLVINIVLHTNENLRTQVISSVSTSFILFLNFICVCVQWHIILFETFSM